MNSLRRYFSACNPIQPTTSSTDGSWNAPDMSRYIRSVEPIGATFSPDGRWIAYYSNLKRPFEAGPNANRGVYVQPFPPTGARHHYYQAKSVKSTIYATQAAAFKSSSPDLASKAQQEAERYATEEAEISKAAKELEKEAHQETESSGRSLEHHHRFAYAVTMFQVSIALAAVAALSRQKAMWLVGLMISGLGIVYFLDGFWLFLSLQRTT